MRPGVQTVGGLLTIHYVISLGGLASRVPLGEGLTRRQTAVHYYKLGDLPLWQPATGLAGMIRYDGKLVCGAER